MIPEIIKQWEENKFKLEEYFKNTKQEGYSSYKDIVKALFECCISEFNVDKMTIIDDGDYQGTQIFIIPKDCYQPSVDDYIVTDTYYGSCSGCDTLQAICAYEYEELPSESQVKDYMTLALHLVQKLHWLSIP